LWLRVCAFDEINEVHSRTHAALYFLLSLGHKMNSLARCVMQPSHARVTGRLSSEVETDPSFQRAQLHRQAADALPFTHEGENEEQGECAVRFISLHFITPPPPPTLLSLYSPPFHQPSPLLRRESVGCTPRFGSHPMARFFCCAEATGTLATINQGTTEYIINTHA
jgi:hypothetical protein